MWSGDAQQLGEAGLWSKSSLATRGRFEGKRQGQAETGGPVVHMWWVMEERKMSGNSVRMEEYGSCESRNRMDGLTEVDVVSMPLTCSCVCVSEE